jgi:fused signal recognition particle receptor
MESKNVADAVLEVLTALSRSYGTSNVVMDVLSVATALSLLALLLGILAYRKSARTSAPDTSSANLRYGRIEGFISDLRGEHARNFEQLRGDIGFIKQELVDIRRLLTSETPPSGTPPTGGREGRAPGVPLRSAAPEREAEATPTASSALELPATKEGESLAARLRNSRRGLLDKIRNVFVSRPGLTEDTIEELEVLLVTSDLGVKTVRTLLEDLREEVGKGHSVTQPELIRLLEDKIFTILQKNAPVESGIYPAPQADGPLVVMVVGVNGAGKTTTVAKLANLWHEAGAKVMMAAADTFRAAAYEQLHQWGAKVGVPVIGGTQNARPSAVVFDAMVEAKKQNVDVLIIDTAGRLHTKSNLMQELSGIKNIISRHQPLAPHETLLVVDGTTGQNAIAQAREFHAAVPLTGLVVTKLDGTAKGGVLVAIKDELDIPIRYIGVGESWGDLRTFDPKEFVQALFEAPDESEEVETAHGQERKRKRKWGGEAEAPA